MCTVTFFPKPGRGFILTHNRDEAPARSIPSLVREKTPLGDTLIFPRDTAGGTWIATSGSGHTVCLLNGAFVLHERVLPYRRSRGLVLLDFFAWENPDLFFQQYDFERIEPFTFLFFEQKSDVGNALRVLEFRWDGQARHLKQLPETEPHFWCSATLYPPAMQVLRAQVFADWLQTHARPGARALHNLHQRGSVGDPTNDFVMNRGGRVQTVSITQVVVDEKNARMRYLDLLAQNQSERRLQHSKRRAEAVNR